MASNDVKKHPPARPSQTAGGERSSGKAAKAKGSKPEKAEAAEADDTDSKRPDLTEAEKAESEKAEALKSEKVGKQIEALDEAAEAGDDPEDIEKLKRKYLVRRFWHTAARFWTDPHSRMAWLLSGAVLAVILLNLVAAYAMNVWNREIFDALEKKNAAAVLNLSMIYFVILVISVGFSKSFMASTTVAWEILQDAMTRFSHWRRQD